VNPFPRGCGRSLRGGLKCASESDGPPAGARIAPHWYVSLSFLFFPFRLMTDYSKVIISKGICRIVGFLSCTERRKLFWTEFREWQFIRTLFPSLLWRRWLEAPPDERAVAHRLISDFVGAFCSIEASHLLAHSITLKILKHERQGPTMPNTKRKLRR
jgi:hypothetical protein